MDSAPTDPTQKAGFTLIETLLAITITVLVLSIVYTAYETILSVQSGVNARENGTHATRQCLNIISRDLMCGINITSDDASFTLNAPTPQHPGSALAFYTTIPEDNSRDRLTWFSILHVSYYLEKTESAYSLIRESRPAHGPDRLNITTNTMLDKIASFTIDAFHNGTWLTDWVSTPEQPWPQAARIAFTRAPHEAPFTTDIYLPLGNVITSSLTRTTTDINPPATTR